MLSNAYFSYEGRCYSITNNNSTPLTLCNFYISVQPGDLQPFMKEISSLEGYFDVENLYTEMVWDDVQECFTAIFFESHLESVKQYLLSRGVLYI